MRQRHMRLIGAKTARPGVIGVVGAGNSVLELENLDASLASCRDLRHSSRRIGEDNELGCGAIEIGQTASGERGSSPDQGRYAKRAVRRFQVRHRALPRRGALCRTLVRGTWRVRARAREVALMTLQLPRRCHWFEGMRGIGRACPPTPYRPGHRRKGRETDRLRRAQASWPQSEGYLQVSTQVGHAWRDAYRGQTPRRRLQPLNPFLATASAAVVSRSGSPGSRGEL